MRNEASFPNRYLFSDSNPAERQVLLKGLLGSYKNLRIKLQETGRLSAITDKALIQMSLNAARQLRALYDEHPHLLHTTPHAPSEPRPEGKPPPRFSLHSLFKGVTSVALAVSLSSAQAPEAAPQKDNIQPFPATTPPALIKTAEAPAHKKALRHEHNTAIVIPSGMLQTLPHVPVKAAPVVKTEAKRARAAKPSAATKIDILFQKPEILVPALKKLQAMGIDDAFKKAVLVESGGRQFDDDGAPLKSSKGATGTAQVMPDTAEKIAVKCTGRPLDNERFHNDATYNGKLGKCYYRARTEAYGGNVIMGALDYNLGPVKMKKHMDKVGDPTKGEIAMDQFLKTIPVKETREYVLKMMQKADLIKPEDLEPTPPERSPEPGYAFEHAGSLHKAELVAEENTLPPKLITTPAGP